MPRQPLHGTCCHRQRIGFSQTADASNISENSGSEQIKTTLALCTEDKVQEGEPASYTCLTVLAKKYLEQKPRDRNFDARNDQIGSGAPVKQKVSVKSL